MKLRLLVMVFICALITACTKDKIYLDTPLDQLLASSLVRASKTKQERKPILAALAMFHLLVLDQGVRKVLQTEELDLESMEKIALN